MLIPHALLSGLIQRTVMISWPKILFVSDAPFSSDAIERLVVVQVKGMSVDLGNNKLFRSISLFNIQTTRQ